ncbi:MAG TPA: helix-turn-helix transcriptional regulator [Actinomycetales bacterium]|uniref:helix-turn-helix domain-containing protein n=1 Tax=Dietzia sp. 179-F 9C3 NHS TaxID=3374295 RepID=UPI001750C3A3|nr:helix-turn-helix transcriptional regulator [Actinomycetales bacterium]
MPNIQMTTLPRPDDRPGRPLLREALGTVLRGLRGETGRTLRDVADVARVSPGYLSEIERGRKEASSELLAAVSDALDVSLGEILIRAALEVSPPGTVAEPVLAA